ncbi:C40 family peptidase [Neoroseomonas soli]|uniref:C40 family peptidase n=1 Tax=Neoroseomonas soli TaxID=1081025 RepID=A0A9X9WS47_9PROT|nr:NlpC/P60 family protein [Neoroseomonas soli]MBR0669976.1 C40 family peptidase [Neoroseomonas soli]
MSAEASVAAANFVTAARSFVGVPWRHLGRARTGLDCIGLVLLAAREAGVDLPDPAPYAREPQGTRLLEGILGHARRVAEAAPGDVLLFRLGLYGGHVGIASVHPAWGVPACLHAYAPRRQVVEQPMDDELRAALLGVFRLPALET